jgi:DNA-binding NtrC family response regulator
MRHKTILYISDRPNRSNPVLAAIEETGCEVVSTNSPTEGVALLYIMHSVIAVVLDSGVGEHASFDVAQRFRRVRPDVPVMLPCGDQIGGSPSWTDSCVSTDELAFALRHLLTENHVVH